MNTNMKAILEFSKQFNFFLQFESYEFKELHHGLASAEIYAFKRFNNEIYEIHIQEGNITRIFAVKRDHDGVFATYDLKKGKWERK